MLTSIRAPWFCDIASTCAVGFWLSTPRTSTTGYQPSSEQEFYVHDEGNPTRALQLGDEVWLIQNDPSVAWPWSYLTVEQAEARCPAMP